MSDQIVREQLVYLLEGGGAHLDFERAIADVPEPLRGARVEGLPYTLWGQLEHLRINLWDILEFSRSAEHVSPEFPDGYWPAEDTPPDSAAWERSVQAFREHLRGMIDLVADPQTDLYAPISHGDGETVLREALLAADHNSYHLGQIVCLRRALGAWTD